MPPLKDYVFELIVNPSIVLSIKAYDIAHAYQILIDVVKYPNEFNLKQS